MNKTDLCSYYDLLHSQFLTENQLDGRIELDRDGGTAFKIRFKNWVDSNSKCTFRRVNDLGRAYAGSQLQRTLRPLTHFWAFPLAANDQEGTS